jgi:hypothetical protein
MVPKNVLTDKLMTSDSFPPAKKIDKITFISHLMTRKKSIKYAHIPIFFKTTCKIINKSKYLYS